MKEVVIIGAGYGGLRAAEHLCKDERLHVTIIDQNPYHYMQTEAYGFIAGRFDMADVAINVQSFTDGLSERVDFKKAKALRIDETKKVVELENAEAHSYDYLIIAVGARTNFFSFIKGAREHTYGVKNIERAFGFRQVFEDRLYQKLQDAKLDRKGDLHIAIAGAGLSGVEIAAEMAFMLECYRKILPTDNVAFQISLIDAAETILPGMDPYIIKGTEKRLGELGVNISTNTFIAEIEERVITFKDGTKQDFDFMIYTAGIKASEFVDALACEKNRQNQIVPDNYLQLTDNNDIFAIGDCTELRDIEGKMLPPTAQTAEKSAAYVAKCISLIESDRHIEPFDASIDGVFVALGGTYAIGVLFGKVKVKGYPAYLLKKLITRGYRLGLELKVNAGYKKRGIKSSLIAGNCRT